MFVIGLALHGALAPLMTPSQAADAPTADASAYDPVAVRVKASLSSSPGLRT